jgi:DNA repair protein RecN (Recombination protein N)
MGTPPRPYSVKRVLVELTVRELALVQEARVEFGPGLNLLTGETGSGKSLIVDALGLVLGDRASSDQVRQGASRAAVEARFEGTDGGSLNLVREVGRRGGARLDGRPATSDELRATGRRLVAVHGQHESQLLLDPEAQTLMLDSFAGALGARLEVASAHAAWSAAASRLQDLELTQARGEREEEHLRWQLEELRAAAPRPAEDSELAAERSAARHAVRLAELTEAALAGLRRDEGLPAAVADLRSAAELDARLHEAAARLEALGEEVADLVGELRRYAEAIDTDPARLEAIESRLSLLDQLKRKYGGSLDAVLAEQERLESRLGTADDLGQALEEARRDVSVRRANLESAAGQLTDLRLKGAAALSRAVLAELDGLSLDGARFEVRLAPRQALAAEGAESAEMLLSANPGEPLAPLVRVASGGELSRVMLAIRTAAAEADSLPTLVFDEVDSGIGGEAATQVGMRLKRLGARHQVLVVTHLAQIACFADRHLLVEKGPGAEGRNVVRVRHLEGPEERARELARMMSGRVTEKALARARELLQEAGNR